VAGQRVLLQSGNWKRQLLICLVLILIGLVILHFWYPGLIRAFFAEIYNILASLYGYLGTFLDYVQKKV
jgi:hypothetical protein